MPNDPPRPVSTDQVNHHNYLCCAAHLPEAPCEDICHSFCRTLKMDDVPSMHVHLLITSSRSAIVGRNPLFQVITVSKSLTSVPRAYRGESLVLLLLPNHIKQRTAPFTRSTSNGTIFFTSPNQGMPMFPSQLIHHPLMFSASLVPHSNRTCNRT